MNRWDYIAQLPWVEPLGWTLVHFLWQGGVIGIAVWLILRWMHTATPQVRHAMAVVGMLLCLLAPVGTLVVLSWQPEIGPGEVVQPSQMGAEISLESTPGGAPKEAVVSAARANGVQGMAWWRKQSRGPMGTSLSRNRSRSSHGTGVRRRITTSSLLLKQDWQAAGAW